MKRIPLNHGQVAIPDWPVDALTENEETNDGHYNSKR